MIPNKNQLPDIEFARRQGWISDREPELVTAEDDTRRRKREGMQRLRAERKGKATDDLPPRVKKPYRARCKCCHALFARAELNGRLCAECENDPGRLPEHFKYRL